MPMNFVVVDDRDLVAVEFRVFQGSKANLFCYKPPFDEEFELSIDLS